MTSDQEAKITFNCPHCGQTMQVPLSWLGRLVRCPNTACAQDVHVPGAASAEPVEEAPPPAPARPQSHAAHAAHAAARGRPLVKPVSHAPGGRDTRHPSSHPAPAASAPSKAPVVIGVAVGAVAALVLAVFLMLPSQPKPPPAPQAPAPIVMEASPAALPAAVSNALASTAPRPAAKRRGEMTDEQRQKISDRLSKGLESKQEHEKQEVQELARQTDSSDGDTLFKLGEAYHFGRGGLAVDEARALEYYTKAAKVEHPGGLLKLGEADLHRTPPDVASASKRLFHAGLLYLDREDKAGASEACRKLIECGAVGTGWAQMLMMKLDSGDLPPGSGTGWFCGGPYVVTCCHVVCLYKKWYIQSDAVPRTAVTVVGRDPENDIAVLKVQDASVVQPGLPLAQGDVELAQKVFTLGYPLRESMGNSLKFNEGSVSSLRGAYDDPADIQISVPIQPGNSGGPLLNTKGEIIGITASSFSGTQNVNYAVRAALVKTLMDKAGVPPGVATLPTKEGNLAEVAERVRKSVVTVFVE